MAIDPRMVSAREIVGRRITGFRYDAHPGAQASGGTLHTGVCIDLDDGSYLLFDTEESENGDAYGTFVWRRRRAVQA